MQRPPAQRSLTVASLDIGRVLADRDGVTFRVQGTCMYPTLRPGDVLRIRSCAASDVVVGDIAVCRTPHYLFSHRVVATGERDGRTYVITRSDRSPPGGEEQTFGDDLLGVVVAAERDGRCVPLQGKQHAGPTAAYHRVRLALVEAEPLARRLAEALAARVQGRAAYRWAARRWYAHRGPRLRVTVRVPLNATLGEAVSRELAPSVFDPEREWNGRRLERWTLVAQVDEAGRPAASATFVRDADDAWRLQAATVRVRYRLLGTVVRSDEHSGGRYGYYGAEYTYGYSEGGAGGGGKKKRRRTPAATE